MVIAGLPYVLYPVLTERGNQILENVPAVGYSYVYQIHDHIGDTGVAAYVPSGETRGEQLSEYDCHSYAWMNGLAFVRDINALVTIGENRGYITVININRNVNNMNQGKARDIILYYGNDDAFSNISNSNLAHSAVLMPSGFIMEKEGFIFQRPTMDPFWGGENRINYPYRGMPAYGYPDKLIHFDITKIP